MTSLFAFKRQGFTLDLLISLHLPHSHTANPSLLFVQLIEGVTTLLNKSRPTLLILEIYLSEKNERADALLGGVLSQT